MMSDDYDRGRKGVVYSLIFLARKREKLVWMRRGEGKIEEITIETGKKLKNEEKWTPFFVC